MLCMHVVSMTADTGSKRMRWLALHNFRSNPEVFSSMLKELIDKLGDIDVDYVQAPHPARGPGLYPGEGFEWWYSPTYKSAMMGWLGDLGLEESMKYLRNKIEVDGPYDGIFGFSQGGGMAHFLLAEGLVKQGILFSPVVPLGRDWPPSKATDFRALVLLDPADFTGEAYPLQGMKVIEHNENHTIPKITDEILSTIASWRAVEK